MKTEMFPEVLFKLNSNLLGILYKGYCEIFFNLVCKFFHRLSLSNSLSERKAIIERGKNGLPGITAAVVEVLLARPQLNWVTLQFHMG